MRWNGRVDSTLWKGRALSISKSHERELFPSCLSIVEVKSKYEGEFSPWEKNALESIKEFGNGNILVFHRPNGCTWETCTVYSSVNALLAINLVGDYTLVKSPHFLFNSWISFYYILLLGFDFCPYPLIQPHPFLPPKNLFSFSPI